VSASRRSLLVAALAVATASAAVLAPAQVFAAGADAERIRGARAHYEQAVAHYNLDEFAPALAEFREAYRLKPDPSFLFNIAQCHRKLGENAAALDFYRKYLRSLPDAPNRADVERVISELREREASPAVPAAPGAAEAPPAAAGAAAEPEVRPAPPPAVLVPAPAPEATLGASPAPAVPAPTPFYQRWWFWTAVGVAVVGGVVTAIALQGPDPYSGTLAPGVVDLGAR
jgi:tetratricopeptide (TPR) repeat protein